MKPSFKTTTLIAAIGMSIAAFYFWAEFVMSHWLGIANFTIFSMPERIARHVFFAIQLLSAAIFFIGVYRYPNQLPQRNRLFIAMLIISLLLLCTESVRVIIGLNTQTFHHPIFFSWYKHVVSVLITAVLWFYYAKSENSPVGTIMRSISLIVSAVFILCLMYYAGLCAGWYFNLIEYYGVVYDISIFFYWLAYISAIVWHIAMLVSKNREVNDNEYRNSIQKHATSGTRIGLVLFMLYMASFIGCIFIIDIVIIPEWVEFIVYITFFSTPIISGALHIYAGETFRRSCSIIKEQQNTIYLYQKLYPNAKQQIEEKERKYITNRKPNNVMRPIITFALTAVLATTFASCNNQSSQSSQPSLERQYIVWSGIDTEIQQVVMDEVDARIKINQADWACAIVLNERGEGIAGYEIYDSTTTHYHLTDKQAIGTIFMPFSLLMASATSFVDSSFTVPVHKEGWRPYEGKKIVDSHPRDTTLRVRDIIATNSYLGVGRALMASIWLKGNGVRNFKHYLTKLGCDSNQFCQWSEFASITGTDVITTPEHIALLYHCLTHRLFPEEWRVESSGVLEGLHDCVWNNELGTASVSKCGDVVIYDRAQSDKVAIMGKTGTVMIDKDPHKHIISFVGIFPEEKPQYTCLVMFGNPKGTYSAGVDCGGTVRRIAERIMTK